MSLVYSSSSFCGAGATLAAGAGRAPFLDCAGAGAVARAAAIRAVASVARRKFMVGILLPGSQSDRALWGACQLQAASSEAHLKTVAVALEAQGVVKAVCGFALQVAGQCQLITTGGSALCASVLHHCASDAVALPCWHHG